MPPSLPGLARRIRARAGVSPLRAEEAIAAEADFAERVLPAIEDWITAGTQ
jgi:hypothetical protein